MDNRCPTCQLDLSGKLLRTKPMDLGSKMMKAPVPYCPGCETLLQKRENPREKVAAVVMLAGIIAFAWSVPRLGPETALVVGPALIVLGLLVITWFFKVHLRHWRRWQEFDLEKHRVIMSRRRRPW